MRDSGMSCQQKILGLIKLFVKFHCTIKKIEIFSKLYRLERNRTAKSPSNQRLNLKGLRY